jgi:hypothetical protein
MKELYAVKKPDLRALLRELPPFVTRTHPRFRELIGYSPRTLANMDSLGLGPSNRIKLGNTIAYERESLVRWLEERSSIL